jgi:hypothetical protein
MSTDKQAGFRMINEDLPPIRDGWTRISVQIGEGTFRMDVPSDRLDACIEDFEAATDMPLSTHRNTLVGDNAVSGIARQEAAAGYNIRVAQAALWLLLHSSDRIRLQQARDDFWKVIIRDGGALVTATCSGYDRGWRFGVLPTTV